MSYIYIIYYRVCQFGTISTDCLPVLVCLVLFYLYQFEFNNIMCGYNYHVHKLITDTISHIPVFVDCTVCLYQHHQDTTCVRINRCVTNFMLTFAVNLQHFNLQTTKYNNLASR